MKLLKQFILIFTLIFTGVANAYDLEVDGIYYKIMSLSDFTCAVTYGDKKYTGDLVIPAQIQYNSRTVKVIGIANNAFEDCTALQTVTIPNSVTEIGDNAFSDCSSLQSVCLSNSVTSIQFSTFKGCSSLQSITIPNSVTSIGNCAFSGCSSLQSIKLSENLKSIEYGCFKDCEKLESLDLPGSLDKIEMNTLGIHTFDNCKNLRNISFNFAKSKLQLDYWSDSNIDLQGWTNTLETIFIDRRLSSKITCLESLRELTIGENTDGVDIEISSANKLTKIICQGKTPPYLPACTNKQYMNIEVKVPKGTLETYQKNSYWKNFWNISEYDGSGVENIASDQTKFEIDRYNLQGQKVNDTYRGIILVRYSDGTTRKMISR